MVPNDSTLDVIKNIQDSRLKVFPYPSAGSAAVSRNRGFPMLLVSLLLF